MSDTAYDFASPVTSDITLCAKWNSVSYTVVYHSNGGTNVASQKVLASSEGVVATQPATNPTLEGYTFVGWYTSKDGGQTLSDAAYDFATPLTGDLTLYAKWKDTVDANDYFIASANLDTATLDSLTNGTAKVTDANTVNYRSQADIDADIAVLHGTATVNRQGEDYNTVKSRWKGYLYSDSGSTTSPGKHLYTKWVAQDGETVSGKNTYVEFRVVEVGEHLNDSSDQSSGDGSAVTFMAIHSLPTAQMMNPATDENPNGTNAGGWEQSYMRTTVMSNYVAKGLAGVAKSATSVKKYTQNGTQYNWDLPSVTTDTFWLMSYKEVTGSSTDNVLNVFDEGNRYAWFKHASDSNGGLDSVIESFYLTRDGTYVDGVEAAAVWLRSPAISLYEDEGAASFMSMGNGGVITGDTSNSLMGVCPAFAM